MLFRSPLDPRFASLEAVGKHYPEFCAEIEKTLAQKTALEWEEIVSGAGVAAMAVRDLYQAIDNPQIKHRGLIHRFPFDAELGYAVTVPKAPYQLSKTGAYIHSPPPRVGQHTDEILQMLGFSASEIVELRKARVVEGLSVAETFARQKKG